LLIKKYKTDYENVIINLEEYIEIDKYCKDLKIPWFASCWDLESFEFVKQFNCPYNKVASARLGHLELLHAIAKEGKHTFIATINWQNFIDFVPVEWL